MSNEKFPVFCPYCGAKMLLKNEIFNLQATDGNRARYWYRCRNEGCECDSPTRETAEEAYKAAMKRYEEPNRVLTLDELKHYNGFIWCESRDGEVFEPGWVEDMYAYGRECETINLCNENIDWSKGRCWLRKPTEKEMENTPWEENA